MVRVHLHTWVVFLSAAISGALLSLMFRKSQHITDKFWLRRAHDLEYQSMLQEKDLTRTEDMLHGRNMLMEETRKVYRESTYLLQHSKILCWIMLDKNNLMEKWQYLLENYFDTPTMMPAKEAIIHTWGKRCSYMVIFSGEPSADSERVPTVPLNTTSDPSSWKAYREAVIFLAQYIGRFHWFLLVEEDSFVIMENLAYYLAIYDFQEPYYFGHVYQTWSTDYNLAGAGIVLSQGTMRKLYNYLSKGQWMSSFLAGEIALGQCLMDLGIRPTDTRDEIGRERFLPFQAETVLLDTFVWSGFFGGSSKYSLAKVSS